MLHTRPPTGHDSHWNICPTTATRLIPRYKISNLWLLMSLRLFFGTRPLHTLSSNFLSLGQYCSCSPAKCLDCGKCQLKISVFSEDVTSTSHNVMSSNFYVIGSQGGCLSITFLLLSEEYAPFVQMSQRSYLYFVHLQQLTKHFLGCGKI